MNFLLRTIQFLILAIGIGTTPGFATSVSPQIQKDFENLVQKSNREGTNCKEFEKKLRLELQGSRRGTTLKSKEQTFQVLKILKNYPGLGPSTREVFKILSGGQLDRSDQTWLGKQILQISGCPLILIFDTSKTVILSASQYRFSLEEWKDLRVTLLRIADDLIQSPGPLLNSMTASHLLEKLGEPPEVKLGQTTILANQDFSQQLEKLRKNLSRLYVGVKVNEPNLFATYLIQETRETEKIRSKFYPILFNSIK